MGITYIIDKKPWSLYIVHHLVYCVKGSANGTGESGKKVLVCFLKSPLFDYRKPRVWFLYKYTIYFSDLGSTCIYDMIFLENWVSQRLATPKVQT